MRERGAFGFLIVVLVSAIWLLGTGADENAATVSTAPDADTAPSIMINGRAYQPIYRGGAGADRTDRMVIVVDRDALAVGENTVEIQWGEAPLPTLTAKLPSDSSTR